MGKWESEELQEDPSGIKDTGNSVGLGVDTKAISSLFFRSILLDFAESFRDCWARLTKRGGWFTGAHFCTGSVWTRQYLLFVYRRKRYWLPLDDYGGSCMRISFCEQLRAQGTSRVDVISIMTTRTIILSLCCAVFAVQPSAPDPIPAPLRDLEWGQLNFLHTTDTHGWLAGHLQEYGNRIREWFTPNDPSRLMLVYANWIYPDHLTQQTGAIMSPSRVGCVRRRKHRDRIYW